MSLLNGLKPGDRIRVTVKDTDSDDTETLDATLIIASETFNTLLVKPDDSLFGMVEHLLIQGAELVALQRITTSPPS